MSVLRELGYGASEIIVYGDREIVTEIKIDDEMIMDNDLQQPVFQPGTLIYYLEPGFEKNYVDKIPGEITRLNYDGTYNVELEDKRYFKSVPVNKLKKIEEDLKVSDGREASGKPKTKVHQITNEQLSKAGYNWFSITWARFVLSTKMTGGGAYIRDADQGLGDFGRGVGKFFTSVFGWIPNPFGHKFEKNSQVQVLRVGFGDWVNGQILNIENEKEKTYRIRVRNGDVVRRKEEFIRWPKDDSKMLGCIPKPSIESPKCGMPEWIPTVTCEPEEIIKWKVNDECEILSPGEMNGWFEGVVVKVKSAIAAKSIVYFYNVTYKDDKGKEQTQKGVYASELRKRKGIWGFLPWV